MKSKHNLLWHLEYVCNFDCNLCNMQVIVMFKLFPSINLIYCDQVILHDIIIWCCIPIVIILPYTRSTSGLDKKLLYFPLKLDPFKVKRWIIRQGNELTPTHIIQGYLHWLKTALNLFYVYCSDRETYLL
jgi:hypothetical protein